MQQPELTTAATRQNSFSLLVALDDQQTATGELFWDDGESLNIIHSKWQHEAIQYAQLC